ncbi:MAG: dihydrolipoamide acetyltransferase family protein, partial [Cyanobacteria bacterium J06635_13]
EGYLAVIMVEAGSEAPVGSAIALIAETEAEIAEAKKQAASHSGGSKPQEAAPRGSSPSVPEGDRRAAGSRSVTAPAEVQTAASNGGNSNASGRTVASPRAKKLAKQLKVDLKSLQGSGPYGRITVNDVEQAAGKPVSAPAVNAAPVVPAGVPVKTPAPAVPGQTVPLNTLQKAVVQNMMTSLQVPTFHVTYTINTDALDGLYKQIKPKGVTMTALLAKAIAVTLKNHPVVNASYAPDAISYNSEINVAVAVAMPDGGLITPVLRNADQMDIYSLSRTWKDLVARSRAKQLQPEEYSTGTFTLSNLGMFGVDNFDAILPQGQGSILAVGGSKPQLVADDAGMMGVKRQMKVNITADHRIIYGAQAAAFLKDLATLIETNVQSLTL